MNYEITLICLLVALCIFWYQCKVRIKADKKQDAIDKKLDTTINMQKRLVAYFDGIPALAKTDPTRKEFDKGRQAMDKKKWSDAIDIFRKLLPEAEGSQKGALLNLIGNCFHWQDNLDEALEHYQESLKLAEEIRDKK
jgi:tetratricopeptide (TPR) repeat protein